MLIVENPGTLSLGGDRIFAIKSNNCSGDSRGAELLSRQASKQGRWAVTEGMWVKLFNPLWPAGHPIPLPEVVLLQKTQQEHPVSVLAASLVQPGILCNLFSSPFPVLAQKPYRGNVSGYTDPDRHGSHPPPAPGSGTSFWQKGEASV